MSVFVIFVISLVLITLLFIMKSREIYYGKKIFLEDFFSRCDAWILKSLLKIKYWWSHVNIKNVSLIFSWIVASIKRLVVTIKRRFDHEQSLFFTKKDQNINKNKGSVSFFLKDVANYKKSLRGETKDHQRNDSV